MEERVPGDRDVQITYSPPGVGQKEPGRDRISDSDGPWMS